MRIANIRWQADAHTWMRFTRLNKAMTADEWHRMLVRVVFNGFLVEVPKNQWKNTFVLRVGTSVEQPDGRYRRATETLYPQTYMNPFLGGHYCMISHLSGGNVITEHKFPFYAHVQWESDDRLTIWQGRFVDQVTVEI